MKSKRNLYFAFGLIALGIAAVIFVALTRDPSLDNQGDNTGGPEQQNVDE